MSEDAKNPITLGDKCKIFSESAPTIYGVLCYIYGHNQIRLMGGEDMEFAQSGYARYDFARLVAPDESKGLITLWSKDGINFEKPGYSKLEVVLAAEQEVADLKESYRF